MSQRLLLDGRLSRVALALAALLALLMGWMLLARPARADTPAPPAGNDVIIWRCWLDPATGCDAYCVRPGGATSDPALDRALADPVTTRRDLLAGGCVARLVRQQPALYAHGLWRIPLNAAPADDTRWPLLLDAVMCGAEPACRIETGPQATAATMP